MAIDVVKTRSNNKKGLIIKTWERCKSWHGSAFRVAPEGCFSVYVGPQKQRFVVKTDHANHPLFRVLLEEAEAEYGYRSAGPIELPCDVHVFFRVLMEMDCDGGVGGGPRLGGCGLPMAAAAGAHV